MDSKSVVAANQLLAVQNFIIAHLTKLTSHPEIKTVFGLFPSENLWDPNSSTIRQLQEMANSEHHESCADEGAHCKCGKDLAEKFLQLLQEAESGQRFSNVGPP